MISVRREVKFSPYFAKGDIIVKKFQILLLTMALILSLAGTAFADQTQGEIAKLKGNAGKIKIIPFYWSVSFAKKC